MADFQLDARPYFQILHSLLRPDDIDYDRDQTAQVVEWLEAKKAVIKRTCSKAEFDVLMVFYAHWENHKIALDRKSIEKVVHARLQPQTLLDVLSEYDKHAPELEVESALNLDVYLDQRRLDYDKYRLTTVLNTAIDITLGSKPIIEKNKTEVYTGSKDAVRFVHEQMQKGILIDDVQAQGGALADTADRIRDRYEIQEAESRNNNLFIPTGIRLIDEHLGGIRRKELVGILGFTGQRKTAVLRSIGYAAASANFRVLHIPLESDYDEEETSYAVMHACSTQNEKDRDHLNISKARIDRSLLTEKEKAYFFDQSLSSYKEKAADRIVVYAPQTRDWAEIRSIIEREIDKAGVDIVLIDYLTMLSTPGARDDIADKMAIIQDAKRFALTANDGVGVCIVTPVQGNRNGYDAANSADGAWMTTGISKYSELDKSLDNLFYTFLNDELNNANLLKMGSCKTRRGANIPSTPVNIDPRSGRVTSRSGPSSSGADTASLPKDSDQGKPTVLSIAVDDLMMGSDQ